MSDKTSLPGRNDRMKKPDFICVGMQKSGTRWLYEQLRGHPEFWMPPLKEIQFFGARFPSPKHMNMLTRRTYNDLRDRDFVQLYQSIESRKNHEIETYLSLFEFAGDLLTGDITPYYSSLNETQIDTVAGHLPDVKIILMVRDPVKRAWSALNDAANDGKLEREAVTDPDAMVRALREKQFQWFSFPSQTFRRWSRRYEVRPFFLEEVSENPAKVRADILTFLGADSSMDSSVPPSHNSKAGRPRADMTPAIRTALINHFRAELDDCAVLLGPYAKGLARKYNSLS